MTRILSRFELLISRGRRRTQLLRSLPIVVAGLVIIGGCTSQLSDDRDEAASAATATTPLAMKDVMAAARAVGFPCGAPLVTAGAVAAATSGLHTDFDRTIGGTAACPVPHERGLWGLNSCRDWDYNDCVFQKECNARGMNAVSGTGADWSKFSAYVDGSYRAKIPDAQAAFNTVCPPASCKTDVENSTLHFNCGSGSIITEVRFASFGNPVGTCGAWAKDSTCDAPKSQSTVENLCLGKASCDIAATNAQFGGDPCPGHAKKLSVELSCALPKTCFLVDVGTNDLTLGCPVGKKIISVDFATYGITPTVNPPASASGVCSSAADSVFQDGTTCNVPNVKARVEGACIGQRACRISATDDQLGTGCTGAGKKFGVKVRCGVPPT